MQKAQLNNTVRWTSYLYRSYTWYSSDGNIERIQLAHTIELLIDHFNSISSTPSEWITACLPWLPCVTLKCDYYVISKKEFKTDWKILYVANIPHHIIHFLVDLRTTGQRYDVLVGSMTFPTIALSVNLPFRNDTFKKKKIVNKAIGITF